MKVARLVFLLLFFACFVFGVESKEIYWYIAASMTKPAQEIVQLFNKRNKQDKLVLITGGSGELLSKIYTSKKGDIYTPANKDFLDKAIKRGIIKKYKPLLIQEPVFAFAPKSNFIVKDIKEICSKPVKIALGNPQSMALGKTFENMKKKMPKGIYKCIQEKKTIDPINISQTVSYLKNNVVDMGLLFKSTAKVNNLKYIDIPSNWNISEKAYLAEVVYTSDDNATQRAIDFIEDNINIFEKNGFDIVK
jgi:molybdate transport system substrate-binding protein